MANADAPSHLARACKLTSAELNECLGSSKTYTPEKSPDYTINTVAYHIDDLPANLRNFVFGLVESNMMELYMKSKNGWCREDKEEEMQDVQSRYLIAFHDDVPVGMIHFQFLEEDTMTDRDAEVAYCYEIQVIPECQRKGIGAYLIGLLETIGRAAKMEKVMLTVFKANKSAIRFYLEQMKYQYDEISPCVSLTRGRASRFDYEILSKSLT
ncbi:N-alpha-acetyltransferase 40 [Podila minutissima]|uniref:N-alpha-acetyltransferase 40 n=1 Tax=Podila minutissima TaxID=64525 RepID=A0A9P5SW58_9FUNG|nr:N-alpha-acetyltransferase 40 [Podila minutissima]